MIFDKTKLLSVFDVTKDAEPMRYGKPPAHARLADQDAAVDQLTPDAIERSDRHRPHPAVPWKDIRDASLILAIAVWSSSGRRHVPAAAPSARLGEAAGASIAWSRRLAGLADPAFAVLLDAARDPSLDQAVLLRVQLRGRRRRAC